MGRIALSPASRRGLVGRIEPLDDRAAVMGVNVSTWKYRREWKVRVRQGSRYIDLRGEGPLEAIIAGALDDFEERYLFTPDELAQIQRQTNAR